MKMFFLFIIMFFSAFAGDIELIESNRHQAVYAVKPNCGPNSRDTIGPIELNRALYMSQDLNFSVLNYKDTAIIDSGIFIRNLASSTCDSSGIRLISTADSVLNPYGEAADSITNRTTPRIKDIQIPYTKCFYVELRRWDTNPDTLDFKDISGTVNKNVWKINIRYDDN